MPSLQRNAAIYLAAAALNAAIPFLVLPWLTRWLGPTEFGRVGSYLALVNIAAVLAGLSTHGLISVVHFRDGRDQVARAVTGSLAVLGITMVPMLLATAIAAPMVARASGLPAGWMWTVPLAAAAQFIVSAGLAVFQAREQPLRVAMLQVGLSLVWASAALVFIGALEWGWEGRGAAQLIGAGALACVALVWLSREAALEIGWPQPATVRAALAFGLPLVPHALAAALMAGADRLVLQGLVGPQATGEYFAAAQIAAVLAVGAAAVNQAWVPWLYRRLAEREAEGLRQAVRATYAAMIAWLLGAALLAVAAPAIVGLVAGAEFAAAAVLLRWLAPAAAFSGMYYFVTNYLFYAERTGWLSAVTVACSAFQLALTVLLARQCGALGVAIATSAGATLYFLSIWAAASRAVSMPWLLRREAAPR